MSSGEMEEWCRWWFRDVCQVRGKLVVLRGRPCGGKTFLDLSSACWSQNPGVRPAKTDDQERKD